MKDRIVPRHFQKVQYLLQPFLWPQYQLLVIYWETGLRAELLALVVHRLHGRVPLLETLSKVFQIEARYGDLIKRTDDEPRDLDQTSEATDESRKEGGSKKSKFSKLDMDMATMLHYQLFLVLFRAFALTKRKGKQRGKWEEETGPNWTQTRRRRSTNLATDNGMDDSAAVPDHKDKL